MSQAKVDRYKEEKKNRAKIMAKQKREWMLTKLCGGILAAAVVVWAGFSVYQSFNGKTSTAENTTVETESYTVNLDAIDNFMENLSVD